MPGLLFLRGDPEQQRRVFRQEKRGLWSSALPLVLEKNGFMAFGEVDEDGLREALAGAAPDCLLVSRLTPEQGVRLAAPLLDWGGPTMFEGPLPRELHAALGITATRPASGIGSVVAVAPGVSDRAREYGYPAGGHLGPPAVRDAIRNERTDWSRLNVPITAQQAQAWRNIGWDAEIWTVQSDVRVLASWESGGGARSPAVVRRGHLTAASFGLFAALGQAHTSEPWDHNEYRSGPRVTGLETLLLALVDDLHAAAGIGRPRVLPWPRGARWALNVRHDFDRFMLPHDVSDLLGLHRELGTSATWYWRSRHLSAGRMRPNRSGRAAIRLIAANPRHEVALHTEQLWNGAEKERTIVERAARRPIAGTSSHGDPDCFRFQGAPNVLWAEKERLAYTELIQQAHFHPHRFATLESDGLIRPLEVMALPHHASLDKARDQAMVRDVLTMGERMIAMGGFLQLMNHPDLNRHALRQSLEGLRRGARLDWTAREVVDWWRRTHVRSHLSITMVSPECFEILSDSAIRDIVIEIRMPGGERRTRVVDLQPGAAAAIRAS
jgi:hypothetical protein